MMDTDAISSLAVAGMVAHQVDSVGGRTGTGTGAGHGHRANAHAGARCLNCDTALAGEFCQACGQRAHVHKSVLHLGEEVLHGLLHFDAKGWRTLPMLVLRPGQLTRRYIDGQRTRFVSPLALFLFMVFLMFFVAWLTSGRSALDLSASAPAMSEASKELGQERQAALKEVAQARAALAAAGSDRGDQAKARTALDESLKRAADIDQALKVFDATGKLETGGKVDLSGFTANTGWPAADAALRHAASNPELTLYKLKNSGSKLSFLLVPITLPFLWLMFFWKRGVTMYDHAVFSLYSLSFMSLMFVGVFILNFVGLSSVLPFLICLVPPVHMFVQLRGTYGLSRWSALWRTGALLFIVTAVFALYLLIILMMSMA